MDGKGALARLTIHFGKIANRIMYYGFLFLKTVTVTVTERLKTESNL